MKKSKDGTEANVKDNTCPQPQGVLLIIGGKENKSDSIPEIKKAPENFTGLAMM